MVVMLTCMIYFSPFFSSIWFLHVFTDKKSLLLELPAEILFTFFFTGWFSDCQRFNTTIIIMLLPISFPYSVYTTYHHDDPIRKEKYLHPLTYNMDIYLRQPRYLSSASKKFNAFKKYRIWIIRIPIWYSRQFIFCSTLLYNVSFYIRT